MRENAYSKMQIILIGNKCDLEDMRQVSTEEGQRFAKQNGISFFETSAKTGDDVVTCFTEAS